MSTLLAVQQPRNMMLRAEAQVRIVGEAASHALAFGRQEAGCPVYSSAHAALEREDAFDVLFLQKAGDARSGPRRRQRVRPDRPPRFGDGRRSLATGPSARIVAGDPTAEYREHPEFRAAEFLAMSLLNWIFSNHGNI